MVKTFKAWRLKVGFGLKGRAQDGTCELEPFNIVLLRAATQGQQCQCRLIGSHHLALAVNQLVELQANFSKGRVFEPTLSGFDQGSGERAAIHMGGLGGITQSWPWVDLLRVESEVMRQCRFFRAIVPRGSAGQELGRQFVNADCAIGQCIVIGVVQCRSALRQVWPQARQLFGRQSDFFANFVADATQVTKPNAINSEEFACVMDAHALQNVLCFQGVTQLRHGGGGRGCERRGVKALRLGWMHGLSRGKDGAPGAQHFFGVVKACFVVATQTFAEKRGETFTGDRIEHIAGDGGFDVEHGR